MANRTFVHAVPIVRDQPEERPAQQRKSRRRFAIRMKKGRKRDMPHATAVDVLLIGPNIPLQSIPEISTIESRLPTNNQGLFPMNHERRDNAPNTLRRPQRIKYPHSLLTDTRNNSGDTAITEFQTDAESPAFLKSTIEEMFRQGSLGMGLPIDDCPRSIDVHQTNLPLDTIPPIEVLSPSAPLRKLLSEITIQNEIQDTLCPRRNEGNEDIIMQTSRSIGFEEKDYLTDLELEQYLEDMQRNHQNILRIMNGSRRSITSDSSMFASLLCDQYRALEQMSVEKKYPAAEWLPGDSSCAPFESSSFDRIYDKRPMKTNHH
jgi:hypothetical protein